MRLTTIKECKAALKKLVQKIPFKNLHTELDEYTVVAHAHQPYSKDTAKVLPRSIKTPKHLAQCQVYLITAQGYMDRILFVKNEMREFRNNLRTIKLAAYKALYQEEYFTDKTAKNMRESILSFEFPQLTKYEEKSTALIERCEDLNWNLKSTMGMIAQLREFASMIGIQLVQHG